MINNVLLAIALMLDPSGPCAEVLNQYPDESFTCIMIEPTEQVPYSARILETETFNLITLD